MRRAVFGSPDAAELIPGLYVGAAPSRRAARLMARKGITYAVDLRSDAGPDARWPATVRTSNYPLLEYEAPGVRALHEIGQRVAARINAGDGVYVHCRAGVQRAPMVACAVLLHLGWSLAAAYDLVSSRRTVTAMSEAQLTVLRELEGTLPKPPSLDTAYGEDSRLNNRVSLEVPHII